MGAPCNVCEKKGGRHASMMRMKPDGALLVSDDRAGAIDRIYYNK